MRENKELREKLWEIVNNARCPHHRCSKVAVLNDFAANELLALLTTESAKSERAGRIAELEKPYNFTLDVSCSDHYKDGFLSAVGQVESAKKKRLAELQAEQDQGEKK